MKMMFDRSKALSFTALIPLLFFSLLAGYCQAQTPGGPQFDKSLLRNGKYEMTCFAESGGRQIEVSTLFIQINTTGKTWSVITTLNLVGSEDQWLDTSIADATTFKPVYRSSFNPNRELQLKYDNEVTGYHYDKKTSKRTTVKEPIHESFYDSYAYPYMLGLLPLTSGYTTSIPVYEFKAANGNNIIKTTIEEVKSNVYTSSLSGTHKVWQVNILEGGTNDRYIYYIDKESRRIWKIEISTKDMNLVMIDKETNFTAFKSTFDKAATLKMIKNGSAVISGQAFAKDNQNEGLLSNIAVVNINKKQFAQPGTTIVLIPYTEYFKEWIRVNEASRKKGRGVPLEKDAADCIKVASVYDDKGHFEFVNLMPGDYLLFTEFGYTHTSIRSEVVGYTDTYVNGLFQGTSENRTSRAYGSNASASLKKIVTIDKAGEKVEVKLKKTL